MQHVALEVRRLIFLSTTTTSGDSGEYKGDLALAQQEPAGVSLVREANHGELLDGSNRAVYDTLHDKDLGRSQHILGCFWSQD